MLCLCQPQEVSVFEFPFESPMSLFLAHVPFFLYFLVSLREIPLDLAILRFLTCYLFPIVLWWSFVQASHPPPRPFSVGDSPPPLSLSCLCVVDSPGNRLLCYTLGHAHPANSLLCHQAAVWTSQVWGQADGGLWGRTRWSEHPGRAEARGAD